MFAREYFFRSIAKASRHPCIFFLVPVLQLVKRPLCFQSISRETCETIVLTRARWKKRSISFFCLHQKKKRWKNVDVVESTKFEDRNGGIIDTQEGHGEIVKRSAGSIVRLVRSSRSRETRYMYSFARLYNVSWEGFLGCCWPIRRLCVHACVCCVCVRALAHLRAYRCACAHSRRPLSTVVKNSCRPNETTKSRVEPEKYWHIGLCLHWILSPKKNHPS